ncbi:hypothetical protein AAC03nite_24780 [Alicyclobacillus acidoterrestris]|nr:hypothetical protein AAC03nite_24780 [Alicyclobacillus acidoterrestris]
MNGVDVRLTFPKPRLAGFKSLWVRKESSSGAASRNPKLRHFYVVVTSSKSTPYRASSGRFINLTIKFP